MFDITIASKIRIKVPYGAKYMWPKFLQQVQADMEMPNPEYRKALKYRRSARGVPSSIVMWEYDQENSMLSLPRGYAWRLFCLLHEHKVSYRLTDNRVNLPAVNFHSRISLREYQEPAVEALVAKATQGVLQAPAGSGKTQMGLDVVARIGQPALWLTHTTDLAQQVLDRAVEVLGIPRREIGMLGAGKEKVGSKLTIGIIQKMARMDLAELEDKFGAVIIDEVHHSPAPSWATVISHLPAKYRYGVTATLDRADGLEVITNLVIGPTVHVISRDLVEKAGGVVVPDLRVIRTTYESSSWNKYQETVKKYRERKLKPPTIPFGNILADVLDSDSRNRLIVDMFVRECPGHSSLVLSERVAHCEDLRAMLADKCPELSTAVIHGKLGKKARKEIITAMNAGELNVLFAVDIAKEGLDIPRLDRLFLVAGGRNEAELEQKVGRIQRACPGKVNAVVFDIVDEKIGVLKAQYYARRKVYKGLGLKMEPAVLSA